MKKLILILMVIALMVPFAQARENVGSQTLFFNKPTVDDYKLIDVNSISAWVTNYGSIFRHPLTGNSGFEYPAGGGVFAIYAAGIWIGAKPVIDGEVGSARVAIAEYSYEYRPGKIIDGAFDDPALARYQIYKWLTGDTPDADAVADGAPETLLGDQFLWSVYNEADAAEHVNMNTGPLGIEVQQSIFAFARTGPLGNTVFMKWLVINKGGNLLQDTYITVWSDPDLGDSGDDFVGCDTTLSLGYCYNSSNVDGEYGEAPPAVGIDFFQGPIVPSLGDTAYVSGQMFLDYKNLPMTSYIYYDNSNENNGNPQTGPEVYYYMQARWRDGARITEGGKGIDPNNPPTNFMYPGDPETGTGWLDTGPADRRFMMTTGPFTLEPWEDTNGNGKEDIGEPGVQEIVAGAVVARGTDNLNSVTLLKQYDELAQLAYDLNFYLAIPPPAPPVEVTLGNQQIILNWSNEDPSVGPTYKEIEAYEANDPLVPRVEDETGHLPDTTYNFEAYVAYQYDFIDKRNAKEIGNWDIANGITEIRDFVLDEGTGEFLEKLVWKGDDGGLQRYLVIDEDKFSSSSLPTLINGKRYWFGVIALGYNEDSSPKTIQSPYIDGVNFLEVIPQPAAVGVSWDMAAQGEMVTSTKEGESDGSAFGLIIDPSQVTGHNYRAEFDTDATGAIFWRLVDENTNQIVVDSAYHQSSDSLDTAYPVADGIQWKILGPTPGINTNIPGPFGDYPDQYNGWSFEGTRWVSWGLNWGGETWDGSLGNGVGFFGSDVGPADYVDVTLNWAGCTDRSDTSALGLAAASMTEYPDRWSKAVEYHRPGYAVQSELADVPFALFDAETDPPRRLKIAIVERNEPPDVLANGLWDMMWDGSAFDESGGREYVFMLNDDYNNADYSQYLDGTLDGTYNGCMYALWPGPRGTHPYLEGTWEMTIFASNVNSPGVTYTFETGAVINPPSQNNTLAKSQLENMTVYPNPYYGTHANERLPTERWVEFTHLPPTCTIRVFNLAGALVRTLERSNVTDRTWERWDLQNESELPVASGLYIYHIDIPDVGEKIGKMVIFMQEERLDTF